MMYWIKAKADSDIRMYLQSIGVLTSEKFVSAGMFITKVPLSEKDILALTLKYEGIEIVPCDSR